MEGLNRCFGRILVYNSGMEYLDETMWVFAARYAHSRDTGGALAVVTSIKNNWSKFSQGTKEKLIKESNEAKYNLDIWKGLREYTPKPK